MTFFLITTRSLRRNDELAASDGENNPRGFKIYIFTLEHRKNFQQVIEQKREIAERHGGTVWMEPCPIKGMTFYLSIFKDL
jgi:hypothetical protein